MCSRPAEQLFLGPRRAVPCRKAGFSKEGFYVRNYNIFWLKLFISF
jgi:hypothetical protein